MRFPAVLQAIKRARPATVERPVALHTARLRGLAVATLALIAFATVALWPAARVELVLYATLDSAPAIAEAFTEETGIPVRVVRLSTGPLLARIAAEGHRPNWTLAWFEGDIAAAALDRAGVLERHIPSQVPWNAVGRALVPASGSWVPTGVTLAGARIVRKGSAGPMGMPDPSISSAAYPLLAGMLHEAGGWPAGRERVAQLLTGRIRLAPTGPALIAQLEAGRIGSALIQSSTAYALARSDPSIEVIVPRRAVLLPSVLMIAREAAADRREDADRFIAFVLSPRAQRLRLDSGAVDSHYWPVVEGVQAREPLPPLSTLSTVHLDPDHWAPLQARVLAWFEPIASKR